MNKAYFIFLAYQTAVIEQLYCKNGFDTLFVCVKIFIKRDVNRFGWSIFL